MKQTPKRNWLLIALAAGMVILIVAGLALLGTYFYLSRQTAAGIQWLNPVEAVRTDAIAPDLAVLTLAGEPDERVIQAALDAGELETAYATLAYSTLLPDTLRSGHWLLLAPRYVERDPLRAAVCYAAALDHAALAPTLSDNARADLALQAGRGFVALKQPEVARLALAEAESIAQHSPILLPSQRRETLAQVAATYQALGDTQAAAALRARLDTASAGPGVKIEPVPQLLPQLHGSVTLPETVTAAIIAREDAAANLAARWLAAAPDARAALTITLGQALRAEDIARAGFYSGATDLPQEDQLALLHDRVAWLTVKLRVAAGAYGADLAPEWRGEQEQLRSELTAAYTDLVNGYGQQLDSLDVADASIARVELLRQAMLWVRLGLFPGNVEELLSGQLGEAASALWSRQGGVGLTVVSQQAAGRRFYLLADGETSVQPGQQ